MKKPKKIKDYNLVITIKQPFATLICEGFISHINTNYGTTHRGKILIHAAAVPDLTYKATEQQIHSLKGRKFVYQTSAIIGEVELVDIVKNHKDIWSIGKQQWIIKNPILYKNPITNITGRPLLWKYSKS